MLTTDLEKAAHYLKTGDLVAIPTETVYGLAAPIFDKTAIENVFKLKQRPFFDPLIVHVSSIEMAKDLVADWPIEAQKLADKFWPGPLSLVLPKNNKVSDMISSGLNTVALRMPDHPMTLKLIEAVGPLAAPSANLFGRTSPTSAQHVLESLGQDLLVLDGGPCQGGIESTVFDVEASSVLRPGLVTVTQLSEVLGRPIHRSESKKSPGHLEHHYMPKAPLVVVSPGFTDDKISAALKEKIAGQMASLKLHRIQLNTSPVIAARELYGALRDNDIEGTAIVLEMPSATSSEVWEAIWDRLKRAATVILKD